MGDTALYRHYNDSDTLLYIGISLNPFNRLSQHERDKDWFKDISTIKTEWFSDRGIAELEEVRAIKSEKPLHNIIHNKAKTVKKLSINKPTRELTQSTIYPIKLKSRDKGLARLLIKYAKHVDGIGYGVMFETPLPYFERSSSRLMRITRRENIMSNEKSIGHMMSRWVTGTTTWANSGRLFISINDTFDTSNLGDCYV